MQQNDKIIELDILKLLTTCLRNWWIILLATILCGSAFFVVTLKTVPPKYKSSVMLYVNNHNIDIGNLSISTSDFSISEKLVALYDVLLKTKDTLDVVAEESGLDYSYSELRSMITSSSVKGTSVLEVTVKSKSPYESKLIAETIGNVLPRVISDIIESADAKIVDHAIVANGRCEPSYSKITILGAFVGFVLSIFVVILIEFLDTTVQNEDDLKAIIGDDIPVLTHIPDFNDSSNKNVKYGKYGNYKYYKQ